MARLKLYSFLVFFSFVCVVSGVEVLIWSGGSWAGFNNKNVYSTPNYLGADIVKEECPVECLFTGDKSKMGIVDGIMFEGQPLADYGYEFLEKPIPFPQKRPGQAFINFGYEQYFYFPIYAEKGYVIHIDVNMTYEQQHSQVPISFVCNWGGGRMEDFLNPPTPKSSKKAIAFMTTNCGGGGANFRTEYTRELMEYIHIDSLGGCMHNTDMPAQFRKPIYDDHGSSMRNKIEVFKEYMFVLTFENNNVTDYVTEKLPCVLQAASVPIYMGAPNIDDWTPGDNSIIKTSDFESPKELAKYLQHLIDHPKEYEKFYEWKQKGLSDVFVDKYKKCVFYGADCRLCMHLDARRKELERKGILRIPEDGFAKSGESPSSLASGFALIFEGENYVTIHTDEALDQALTSSFTIAAWIYLEAVDRGMRIVDKNSAGAIDGITFDVQPYLSKSSTQRYSLLRLCAASRCFLGSRPLHVQEWYYVAVSFKLGNEGVTFSVNGEIDVSYAHFQAAKSNSLPLRIGKAARGSSSEIFYGKMDDVSVWSIALPVSEIQKNAFKRMAGHEEGLEGYWSFNDGKGVNVLDSSVHGRNGIIENKEGELLSDKWVESQLKPLTLAGCW